MCEYRGVKPTCEMKVTVAGPLWHSPPAPIPRENGLSVSIHVGTRKMCELCLSRVKPGETLVEARSDSDVQIDRQTWV
jgi:hypothetical protein